MWMFWADYSTAQDELKALTGATVIDPAERTFIENALVLIEGERIRQVAPAGNVTIPDRTEVVDVSGQWIIPGLVDAHVHFFQSGGLYTRPDVIDLRHIVPYQQELQQIDERLEDIFARYLASAVTGVADVGGPFWNFEVRKRAKAARAAPHVAVAGPLISTYQPRELTTDDPPIIRVDTPRDARELVRRQAERDADLIKIWYIVGADESPEHHRPLVDATAEESRRHDIPLSVHATELETAREAVRAGADILVHSVTDRPVDDTFIKLLVEHEVIYIPTLTVFERYPMVLTQQLDLTEPEQELAHPDIVSSLYDLQELPEDELTRQIIRRMQNPEPVPPDQVAIDNLAAIHEAGVTVAAGTDAGNIGTLHGPSIFREFQLMEQAGLSPLEILEAATVNGARVMGMEGETGTLIPGLQADLVVLDADPREDIMNAARIDKVLRAGRIHEQQDLLNR